MFRLTAHEIRDMIKNKEISSVEATKAALTRIEEVEKDVDSFITILSSEALKSAEAVDRKISKGEKVGKLAGVPMALKDNICTKDVLTTCASKMLREFVPPYDSTVAKKLKSEDAVLLGKLNMDEFAMGSSTENSYFKKTKNPYDLSRVPGGSSGGSAAAVAADEAFFALGSDTGGSIRQPAAFCGCVGLKPTYGAVSRFGLVAFASSLDQIGPVTKDVLDSAMVLDAISGYDEMDSTSVSMACCGFEKNLSENVKGLKIGVPSEFISAGIDKEILDAIFSALESFKALGASVADASLPLNKYALPAYYIISSSEASSNLSRYDGVKYGFRADNPCDLSDLYLRSRSEGFGNEVKRRIMLGTYALSSGYYDAYYEKAQKVRTKIMQDFSDAFEKFDVLVTPVSPTVAFKLGEKTADPMEMYLADVCTVSINIAGLPAIVIPCGYDKNGLPIGIQIIGKPFGEQTILNAAFCLEKTVKRQRPRLEEKDDEI